MRVTSEATGWAVRAPRRGTSPTAPIAQPAQTAYDGWTLAQLMDRSFVAVHRFARLQLSAPDAEDVTSEVFAVVLRRLDDLPSDPDRAHAWVMSTARRVVWAHIRSLQRRRALVGRLKLQYRQAPSESADAHVDLVAIRDAVARLGRRDREVIGLLVAGELDRDGIARALGCTSSAAGVRIHRARKRLRQALADEDLGREVPS